MKNSLVAFLLSLVSLSATAHRSDVWLMLSANTVAVSPQNIRTRADVPIDVGSGAYLFKADFGDFARGPYGTDEPGYEAEASTFKPGVVMSYIASGQLTFWDGNRWTTNLPDGERVHLTGALGTNTVWHGAGVTNAEGVVDQVFDDGSIHGRLDFALESTSGTDDPAVGAYRVELVMLARDGIDGPVVHQVSAPFNIVFNNQLSAGEFNSAMSALTGDE